MRVELVAVVRPGTVRVARVFSDGRFFRRHVKPYIGCLVRLAFDVSRLPPQTRSGGDAQKSTQETAKNPKTHAQKLRARKSRKKPENAEKRRNMLKKLENKKSALEFAIIKKRLKTKSDQGRPSGISQVRGAAAD